MKATFAQVINIMLCTVQAMEAVATVVGVDASKLSLEKKSDPKRKRRSPSPKRSPKREVRGSPAKQVKQEPAQQAAAAVVKSEPGDAAAVKTENGAVKTEAAPAIQPPPTIPADSFPIGKLGAGVADAQNKAQQIELEKKLMEQGEPATLKQQEDMSIKGKSARQMVMQRLMGSRTKVESVVLLLRNMVSAEDVDETLQEEIEEECNKYGKVCKVNLYVYKLILIF